jgi:hypothetical protein
LDGGGEEGGGASGGEGVSGGEGGGEGGLGEGEGGGEAVVPVVVSARSEKMTDEELSTQCG